MSKRRKKKDRKKERSTAALAKRRAETHKAGYENTAFELPDGKKAFVLKSDKVVRLDIIPFEVGEGNPQADKDELYYERTYFVHPRIGTDQTSFVCLAKTCGEPCPICEFRGKLMKDPDADEDLIKDLGPKERQLFNVINTKDRSAGVQIWDMSFHTFGKKLDYEIKNSDEDDGYENFAELKGGFTLKLGIDQRHYGSVAFFEVVAINFKPRVKDYDEDILEEATCLDDILIVKDYDELKEIFLQTVEDENEDEDEDKKKGKAKGKKGGKKKDKDENWGDEDEDDNGDDENDDKDENGDEDEDDVNDSDVPDWSKDDRVVVEIDGEDYPGVITKIDEDEEEATVKFDDGDTGTHPFDELKAEPEPESKKSKKAGKKSGKDKKNKCPGGGKFGKDTDELPECDDCPIWDECDDA